MQVRKGESDFNRLEANAAKKVDLGDLKVRTM